jgi:hypothetical protein
MLIAILNKSAHFTGLPNLVEAMAEAVQQQIQRHASVAWGRAAWAVQYFRDVTAVPKSASRLWLLDHPDVAGALGYHDQDPHGYPYGKVFVDLILQNGGTEIDGPNSVSVTLSHEALEIYGDPIANRWAQMPNGTLIALELCDPVEGDSYPMKLSTGTSPVSVSNFVFPEYFDGKPTSRRFDQLGKLAAPYSMDAGGYQILMDGGQVRSVFGAAFPAWKHGAKQFAGSRTARRRHP